MGFHTYPVENADALEDESRYRYCSREELVELLDVDADAVVADLGAGTGFYTRDVAPFVGTMFAVDVQAGMHDVHRQNGLPESTRLVTADVSSLPFEDGQLDAAFSVMTHHEYADRETLSEIGRVLRSGGRLVTVDWSATGTGESGPSTDERFTPSEVSDQLEEAGFAVETIRDRPETLAAVGRR
jgi:ubiquinone/menaquinone biosynthesis C-methylase UbiE